MLTDTHAHLDFPDFAGDLDGVLARAEEAGVRRIISIGTSVESSQRAIALAERFPQVWAVVGVHPNAATEAAAGFCKELRELARHPRVVAIGETGLDYYRLPSPQTPEEEAHVAEVKAIQASVYEQQLQLAAELGLNVVIHQRASWDDTLRLLTPFSDRLRAVYHCFGEVPERMAQVLTLGHLVSFTGIVTFKNAADVQRSAVAVPADRFMVETDCPFLAPIPHRGKRAEPAFTRLTAEKLAELRRCPLEELARQTEATAERFFRFQR